MVVLMDPMEDPEDILRANRSREKQFVFDTCFDGGCTQVIDSLSFKSPTLFVDGIQNGCV